MRVSKIHEYFPELIIAGNLDTDFSGIMLDSRKVKSGDIFVAIRGSKLDSHTKIYEAFDNGAVGVVIEKDMIIPEGKFKIITDNSRKTYALISSLYFNFPSKRLKLIGITGTSGKTTTAFLMYKLFNLMNLKAGFIGTIGVGKGDFFTISETFPPTTPDAFPLNSMLSEMLSEGIQYVFVEVSSHAIKLQRVESLRFYKKILTTVGEEALDFHETFKDYLDTKISFFFDCKDAIFNADCKYIEKFEEASSNYILYGINNPSDIKGSILSINPENTIFTIDYQKINIKIDLQMSGIFNVYNFLALASVVFTEELDASYLLNFAKHIPRVPGRSNFYRKNDRTIFVDYAHNPFELENVLQHLKNLSDGRLITVIGAVGFSTDKKKYEMGEIASKYSDFVFVTTDDPRGDDPEKIVKDVFAGVKGNGKIVLDRKKAIKEALETSKFGDVVAILGRGDDEEIHYSDRTVYFADLDIVKEVFGDF